jgi:hypothetical protein
MTWLVIAALGVWIALSGFILLVICIQSSRFSQMQGPMRRHRPRAVIPERQGIAEGQTSQSPVSAE